MAGIPHGEAGSISGIDVVDQGHPPNRRETTQTTSGSMAGSGLPVNAPKK